MDLKQLVQLNKSQGESQYCFHNLQRIMLKPLDKKKGCVAMSEYRFIYLNELAALP